MFSCEKYFHEEATSLGKIETVEALEDATQGVYAKLAEALSTDNGINVIMSPNIKGDDINLGSENYQEYYSNEPDCWELSGQTLENYSSSQNYPWKVLYQVIVSANNILKQFTISETENTEICHLLGEVIFLRAYCFFRLTRTYGQIPIITDTEISYQVKLADFETIYSFLEQELKQSSDLLPKNVDEARIPYITVHKGVALALLAEVYLHWAGYPIKENEKYRLAAQTALGVIDSADYYGFQLQEDFADVWDNNIHRNPESIFNIYFENAENATSLGEASLLMYIGFSYIIIKRCI